MLKRGRYKTEAGSVVEISGQHSGIARLEFDWFEEGGCHDCVADPYPYEFDEDHWRILWSCDYCEGGSARLFAV